jgi:hypothetical protein
VDVRAQWFPGTSAENEKAQTIKVRALIVDGPVKEYILGGPHEVAERLFVVKRAFRGERQFAGRIVCALAIAPATRRMDARRPPDLENRGTDWPSQAGEEVASE